MFVGYLAKLVLPRPDWLAVPAVEDIGSVSECMSHGPPDRIAAWSHNSAGCYATEAEALAVVPAEQRERYTLFAYRIWPLALAEGRDPDWDVRAEWPDLPDPPDLASYQLLGHDAIGRGGSDLFGCSPLSCNGVAAEHEVNRHCLIDEPDRALAIARAFADPSSHVEPGTYHVVEVWRRLGGG